MEEGDWRLGMEIGVWSGMQKGLVKENWAWEEAPFLILVFGASLGLESSGGI